MKLKNYIKIDGNWYRGLCDDCLTPLKGIYTKKCNMCHEYKLPKNCVHNVPHSEATKLVLKRKATKSVLSYNGIHSWLRREYGTAKACKNRLCENKSRKYNWAKLKGKRYVKDISCYTQLCTSCHVKYDRWGYEVKV